jgi:hypothetical protein
MNQHQGKRSKNLAKHYERQFDITDRNKARRKARRTRRAASHKANGATGMNDSHKANKAVSRARRLKTKAFRLAKAEAEAKANANK